ncbi:hypothetical protein RRG08_005218 [Elysia crispata]|uniref:Uncharacterized protein n=1 Tax=Elysia crispata TaxID=231223 RepID=A0AAE1DPA9_9GAST|nr:hypothetical protein RRG08_005218 [Elysia crispata]
MSYLLPGGTSLPAASGPGAVISYQVPIISGNMTSANSTNLTADVAQESAKVSSSALEYFEPLSPRMSPDAIVSSCVP